MEGLIARFSGRKFLLAAAAFITAASAGEWGAAVAVVVGFLGVEGTADVVVRKVSAQAEAYKTARKAK